MERNKDKIRLLNYQLIATIIFIGSVIISSYFTYDEIKKLRGENHLNEIKKGKYSFYLRTLSVIIVIIFLYVDIGNYKIAKNNNENTKSLFISVIVSSITLVAAVISLLNTFNNNQLAEVENPDV